MPGMTGAQAQSYFSGLSGGGGIFSGTGPTIGQGIGGLASIGSGIFNLASGGGSTSSMVSGIGQTIGGIVTMLPIPGAQIVGPAHLSGCESVRRPLWRRRPQDSAAARSGLGAGHLRRPGMGGFNSSGSGD